jgi:hypothetical protein
VNTNAETTDPATAIPKKSASVFGGMSMPASGLSIAAPPEDSASGSAEPLPCTGNEIAPVMPVHQRLSERSSGARLKEVRISPKRDPRRLLQGSGGGPSREIERPCWGQEL